MLRVKVDVTESGPKSFTSRVLHLMFALALFGLVLYIPFLAIKKKQQCVISVPIPQTVKVSNATSYTQEECLELEVADTSDEQIKGLSGRKSMPANKGMLFVFQNPSEKCIWMKDMEFSLDIIWVNENKEIVDIKRGVSPKTYPKSFCAGPAKYVIELNSGVANKARLSIGQRLNL